MKTKDKIKKFVTEHKTEIEAAVAVIGVAALSGVLGYEVCKYRVNARVSILHDDIGKVFSDAYAKGLCPGTVFTSISNEPLKADDMGKIGEAIKSSPKYDEEMTFTHFIGIGKPVNK